MGTPKKCPHVPLIPLDGLLKPVAHGVSPLGRMATQEARSAGDHQTRGINPNPHERSGVPEPAPTRWPSLTPPHPWVAYQGSLAAGLDK